MSVDPESPTMTRLAGAKFLRVPMPAFRELIKTGKIRTASVPGKRLPVILRSSVEDYYEELYGADRQRAG